MVTHSIAHGSKGSREGCDTASNTRDLTLLTITAKRWNNSGKALDNNRRRVAVEKEANIEDKLTGGQANDHERRNQNDDGLDGSAYMISLLDASHVASLDKGHANTDEQEHLALLNAVVVEFVVD